MRFQISRRLLLAAASALSLPFYTLGADTTWTNASGNGLWSDPINWEGGRIPTADDTAYLLAAGTITLPASPPATARFLRPDFMVPHSSPITLTGGRLVAEQIENFGHGGPFTIASDLGAPADYLEMSDIAADGAIGNGAGAGSFDVLSINSRLGGSDTSSGDLILFASYLEDGGSAASAAHVVVVSSGTINGSSSFPSLDRLPDAGTVQMEFATLAFNAGPAPTTAESLGTLMLSHGRNAVLLSAPGSASLVLTAQSLDRQPGTTLRLGSSSAARLRFVQPPISGGGAGPADLPVLGYGVGTLSDGSTTRFNFLTYDAGANPADVGDDPGLRPLAWDTEYATTIGAGGGNVRVSGDQSLAASSSISSLNLADGSLSLAGGARLTINSGLMLQGSATATGVGGDGTLSFPGEAVILGFDRASAATIDVPIEATSLTKGGDGEVGLTRANSIPGGVYASEGTLTSRAAGALGGGTVTIAGGAIRIENESQTLDHVIAKTGYSKQTSDTEFGFGAGGATLSVASGLTATLPDLSGGSELTISGGGTVHLPAGGRNQDVSFEVDGGSELRLNTAPGSGAPVVNLHDGTLSGANTQVHWLLADDIAAGDNVVISPGPGTAAMTFDILFLGVGSTASTAPLLRLDLNGTAAGEHDQLRVTQSEWIGGMAFDLDVGYAAQYGDTFTIIDNTFKNSIFPTPDFPAEGSTFMSNGRQFRISYTGGDGNDVTLTLVPEPATAAVLLGAVGMMLIRRQRRPFTRG